MKHNLDHLLIRNNFQVFDYFQEAISTMQEKNSIVTTNAQILQIVTK